MKNFLKISVLGAMLFVSLGVFAADDNFSLTVKNGNEKSIVFFMNETQCVNLSIFTSDNEMVYEQRINANGASKKTYNLDAFPDGNYILKLETQSKLTTYLITIGDGKTTISNPTVKELFKPTLTKEKDIITLNLKTQVKGVVDVIILNELNDQLYNRTFAKAGLIQKFDVSRTDAKELTFLVKYEDNEHIETFKLR